ncbi:MAG: undecaprenyl diphosphate synthase family protein, partial [Armatimonadetes bacterium]|nr:undecaprenyl diphosphate synthase family protein [Armatimonadota bacterium]
MAAHDDQDTQGIEDLKRRVQGLPSLPRHIAIVMDGNGRWAQQRGLPRIQGHFEGRKATKRTVRACAAIGIEVLSLYAFSVENWRRP